ncbi:DegQ family serine endoprotease [Kiloniella sp. b19]|uniref:DegQ family serine endoprotease n=1 Tax=Kiloniella sp. GXU_MW_B19 TaxID=3141326 RepID=UPI0031D9C60C
MNRTGSLRSAALAGGFAIALAALPSLVVAQDNQTTRTVPVSQQQVLLSYSEVVKKTAPAVVNIFTKQEVTQKQARLPGLFNDPFFKRFFGQNAPARKRKSNSLGSGVIATEDGLIVTNHHVIKGATEIKVVLSDRREFDAQLVISDEATDLAILQIDPGNETLPVLEFQDSDSIEVGDLVLAIGNPFGVGQTVTSGIVSALARTRVGVADYQFFIQTDAAINPGNSGGALVTMDGKLLGINTAIFSKSGGSIGIGFAIPANMVQTVVSSAVEGNEVIRGWPGLTGQTLTSDLAEGFGLSRPGGVLVAKIYPGGPADLAGLQEGDVILAVNNQEITDFQSLRFRIATVPVGQQTDLKIWRNRQELTLPYISSMAPETPPANRQFVEGRTPLSGAELANLSPALAETLDLIGQWDGVVITRVASRSPAAQLGFKPRDIVLSVNGVESRRVTDIETGLQQPGQRWKVVVRRNGKIKTLDRKR